MLPVAGAIGRLPVLSQAPMIPRGLCTDVCVCVYIYIHTYIYNIIHIHNIYIYIYTPYTHTHTHTVAYIHTFVLVRVCVYVSLTPHLQVSYVHDTLCVCVGVRCQ